VIVSSAFGLTEAGEYAKSVRIAALLGLLMTVLAAKISPSIAAFRVSNDIAGARTYAQRWTTLTFLAALPPALAMLLFGREIGQLIFGSFAVAAFPVLQALVFAQIVNLLVGPASELLVMHGHRWAVFIIVAISTGLGLSFMLLIAFVFGGSLLAFAWAVAVTIALTQLGYAAGLYAKEGYWSGLNLALCGLALRRLRKR
jgi:O-antigen/teichoic acid export membrane protein